MSEAARGPVVNIHVTGGMKASDGTEVFVDESTVTFRKYGPRGGKGPSWSVRLRDWPAIQGAVNDTLDAIERAKRSTEASP